MMTNALKTGFALIVFCAAAQAGEPISYTIGDDRYDGYIAKANTEHGTIVLLPTWNGLSDYEMDRAQMLAKLGFTTFAADLYPSGRAPKTMEAKKAALQTHLSDLDGMHEMLRGVITQARDNGADPLFVMGYSMGAITAMELAWSGLGKELGVDGYVIFSGRVSDTHGRMMPDGTAPFFVAHGDADTQVNVTGLDNFVDDADLAGAPVSAHVYAGAGHLFSAFGFPNYDAAADADSWAKLTAFLTDHAGF
ncbi:dienelactone hydrolase family protein [Mameliella alba]|uniref:dienelactone hydrolase family protein n=2 Tax=Mameliella alba TaxID=561184 RepID=UPI001430B2CF|nr:dienelactone hydrolase family protein [Mameliella alba]